MKRMNTHLDREVERFQHKFPNQDVAENIREEIHKRIAHLRKRIEDLRD